MMHRAALIACALGLVSVAHAQPLDGDPDGVAALEALVERYRAFEHYADRADVTYVQVHGDEDWPVETVMSFTSQFGFDRSGRVALRSGFSHDVLCDAKRLQVSDLSKTRYTEERAPELADVKLEADNPVCPIHPIAPLLLDGWSSRTILGEVERVTGVHRAELDGIACDVVTVETDVAWMYSGLHDETGARSRPELPLADAAVWIGVASGFVLQVELDASESAAEAWQLRFPAARPGIRPPPVSVSKVTMRLRGTNTDPVPDVMFRLDTIGMVPVKTVGFDYERDVDRMDLDDATKEDLKRRWREEWGR